MGVEVCDSRRLSPAAQEDLRRRVVAAVMDGMTQAAAAATFRVSEKAVWRWVNAFRQKGNAGLTAGRRGRRAGEQKALSASQQRRVYRAVTGKCPDQLALPGLVWTRVQVRALIRVWFGIDLSLVTIGKYLHQWGLSVQKPIRKAYEQDPAAVARWLQVEYPAIAERARKDHAVILWLDQTGIRSDAPVGTTWAPIGQTPVVGKTGRRFSVNAMAAISNKGELYFTCYTGTFTAKVLLGFLSRLTRHLNRKIHLIVDCHSVHRRALVRDWLAQRTDRIEMHFLPSYSPELNPVELLNGDLKRHVAQRDPATRAQLAAETDRHLRRRQRQPEAVKALFGKPEVRYAAE